MPLPTLSVPKYKLKIPSSGKMITYRPFLVKEEKILMTALETDGSEEALLIALLELVNTCVETKKFKAEDLTLFDLEFIFTQLRAKSVGEIVEMNIKCQNEECGISFPWEHDLSTVKINREKEHTNKIQLSGELGVVMKYPGVMDAVKLENTEKSQTASLFEMVATCIDSIYTNEEVYSHKDHTKEELETFVEQLSPEFFLKVMNFFETMPSMKNTIKCTCPKCKEETELVIRGLEDFFT